MKMTTLMRMKNIFFKLYENENNLSTSKFKPVYAYYSMYTLYLINLQEKSLFYRATLLQSVVYATTVLLGPAVIT